MSGIAYFDYVVFVRSLGTPWETRDERLDSLTQTAQARANVWVDRLVFIAIAFSLASSLAFVYGEWRFHHALAIASNLP